MIEEVLVKELFNNRALSSKRIRVDAKEVESTVNQIFDYIKAFNSMDECQDRVLDSNLSNIKVAKEFIPFLLPDSVRLDPNDRKTVDLLIRESKKDVPTNLDVNDFHDLESRFRGYFRKDFSQDFETLDHIKVPKSLADVIPRMTVNFDKAWWVKYDTSAYIPIPLDSEVVGGLFHKFYFNATYNEMIKEYFMPLVF